ncbi:MAG: glycerate kinase [Rhodoferax sp.]
MPHDPARFLRHLYDVAVERALPLHNMARWLPDVPDPAQGRTLVLGAGKAAGAMAHALEALWQAHAQRQGLPSAPLSGLVVTRYGHTPPRPAGVRPCIEVVEAAHPVPDEASLTAAQRMLALATGQASGQPLTEHDLVLFLVSGGGSALLTLPCQGLSLADKQRINRELLESGADIVQMNQVRKHLSRIKGGQLAAASHPARVVTLAISDVPGDDVGVIASGPTVADDSSCADALRVIERYGLSVPDAVQAALRTGALETPKPGDSRLRRCQTHLIATPQHSLEAAAQAAREAGVRAYILSDEIEGESREVGKVMAAIAKSTRAHKSAFETPCVILSGGETTVSLKTHPGPAPGPNRGRGGRAGEFCLGFAQGSAGQPGIWALAADTDGIDGVQDNAGAIVAPDTLQRARALGLQLADYQARNDSYGYFSALGDLVFTGPTHTNVNDFRAVLVQPAQH